METFTIDNLKPDFSFTADLLLDEKYVLLPANVPLSEEMIKFLTEWQFKKFLSDGQMSLTGAGQKEETPEEAPEALQETPAKKLGESVRQVLASGDACSLANSDDSRLAFVQQVYDEYMHYINSVYTHYATHKKIDINELSDTVKTLCDFLKNHKRFVLRAAAFPDTKDWNYLIIHAMRSTVLAITLGMELHLALSKLIELGMTCILHEIGMLRLPPQLYLTDRLLSLSERAKVASHTIFGYNIIKELAFPLSVQLGVLEHHEKQNGSGYPRKLSGAKISTYAKIIAVACSFEAISSPRGYKTDRTVFDAMVELLKNQNGQYDDAVIKALLNSVSFYPIGVYVYLSSGKLGVITDTVPNNPRHPLVQLVNEREADGTAKTVQSDEELNKIVRVLTAKEQKEVMENMREQKEKEEDAKTKSAPHSEGTLPDDSVTEAELVAEADTGEAQDKNGFSEINPTEFM